MTAVSEDENVRRFAHGLATAASRIGSWQIRNRATLGGNLANASPAADTPPALASLDAHVTLASPRGSRELPVALVPDGPNHSTLARDEVVVRFSIPLKPKRASSFGKIGLRSEVSIARLNLAASVAVNRTSKKKPPEISDPLVFVGTLGTAVRRCFGAEAALAHRPLDDAAAFCNALAAVVEKAIPGRATLPYKRSAIRALGEDVLAALCKEVGTLS
jgi:carbon-monoxide dehydrogenase medium subunit